MNKLFMLLCTMLFCGLVSCSGAGKTNETINAVEKEDSCIKESKNTYEVYIPKRDNIAGKLPLLVILDAHGNGKFALEKFKQGANQYPAVLIASNLIKNGFEDYEGAISTLIEDVRQKYPAGDKILMTGFSGGARMVLGYALTHSVDGLILCGASANPNQVNSLHCPVITISGMDDFNFMETAQYLFQEQTIPGNLKIELTNESHSWPDSLILANSLGLLRFTLKSDDIPSLPDSQLTLFCRKQHIRINSFKQQGDLLKASLVTRNMAVTIPFNHDKAFESDYNALKAEHDYISTLKKLEKCLNYETSLRQMYIDAFRSKDTSWWKNEISITDNKIKTEQDSSTRDMYRRIKGFWGIACYTFCKQAVKEQNAETLNKILSIYRTLEPENTDMLYFSSFSYYWKGDRDTTLLMLRKSLKAGYSDRSQLIKDFPEAITSKL